MAHRPIGELQPPTVEKCVLADEHGVGSLASKRREGGVNLATRAGVEDLELQSHGAAGRFHLAQGDLRVGSIGGIDEYGHTRGRRQHFAQQLEPLCRQFETQQIDAGQISSRAVAPNVPHSPRTKTATAFSAWCIMSSPRLRSWMSA